MSVTEEMPQFGPDIALKVDITSGSMTLLTGSKLNNYTNYSLSTPDIIGQIYKNNSRCATVTINSSTGALSMTALTVAAGDAVEFRFRVGRPLSLPWFHRFTLTRSMFLTVAAGNTQVTFDSTNNPMPVPTFNFGFGWTTGNNLKLGVMVSAKDGATQNLTGYVRLYGTCPKQESSLDVDLNNTSTAQTVTSTFVKTDMDRDCEIELYLKSGTGTTRQEESVRIGFELKEKIDDYPASFPTGAQIGQTKVAGGLKHTKLV